MDDSEGQDPSSRDGATQQADTGATTKAERAHALSGSFSGASYWGTPSAPEAPAAEPGPDAEPSERPDPAADSAGPPDAPVSSPADSASAPGGTLQPRAQERHPPMADYQASLNEAMQIDGALGVALVDSQSGMALATAGNPDGLDLNVAAAGNSNVVQAKLRTMRDLGLNQKIEDILITLDSQYHIIRTFGREEGVFLYLVLDKQRANLAMARFKLAGIERQLVI